MTFNELDKHLSKYYKKTSSFISGLSLFLLDAVVLFVCIGMGFFIVNLFYSEGINFKSFINFSIYIPFILFLFACVGLYPGIMDSPTDEVKRYFFCILVSVVGIIITVIVADLNNYKLSEIIKKDSEDICVAIALILTIPIATIFLPGFREVAKHTFAKKQWWGVPAVFYCSGEDAYFIIDKMLNNMYLGYHPAIIINSEVISNTEYCNIPVFPPSDKVFEIIEKYKIKQAVICDYKGDYQHLISTYRYTITVSKNQALFTSTQQLKDIAGIIGYASIHNLTFRRNLFLKRLLDVVIIIFSSPLVIPIMLVLAILTKCTSKGPVFYGHVRIGKNGKPFKCWKFRSMNINSQEMLKEILENDPVRRAEWEKDRKFIDDPRVTKFGKFLRKTSLDELPQLINILFGQMSFVGPRPVTEPELVKYGEYKDYVLSVAPGLTGMWQVSGRSDTGYEERVSFDTYYIQNWSIWLDVWILIKTVWVVLKGKGAY